MTRMSMGGNVTLSATSVHAALRWTAGPGAPDIDAAALLLGADGQVGDLTPQPSDSTSSQLIASFAMRPDAEAAHVRTAIGDFHDFRTVQTRKPCVATR